MVTLLYYFKTLICYTKDLKNVLYISDLFLKYISLSGFIFECSI